METPCKFILLIKHKSLYTPYLKSLSHNFKKVFEIFKKVSNNQIIIKPTIFFVRLFEIFSKNVHPIF